jgi:hypothetical protein
VIPKVFASLVVTIALALFLTSMVGKTERLHFSRSGVPKFPLAPISCRIAAIPLSTDSVEKDRQ